MTFLLYGYALQNVAIDAVTLAILNGCSSEGQPPIGREVKVVGSVAF